MRIGHGYDVHRLTEGRKLILGGVDIPYEKGLLVISLGQNILRIQPPLNIRTENLKKGFEILAEAVEDYRHGRIPDDVFHFRQGW